MSHKGILVPAICVLLASTMAVSGCGNSIPQRGNIIAEFTYAMNQCYAALCYTSGLEYAHKGEYDKAIAIYTKAIALDPEADGYYFRGRAYEDKGEYDEAIADYTRAIELDPEFWPAYQARGNTYESRGEYDKTINDYTKWIELRPESARAYYERGLAYKSKGEYEQAASDFETVIQTSNSAGLVLDAREELKSIGK